MTTVPGNGPEREDDDFERRFADIVAHWHDPAAEPVRDPNEAGPPSDTSPDAPAEDTPDDPSDAPTDGASDGAAGGPFAGGAPPATGWRVHSPPEDDEHFVPPPPSPLPRGDLSFWGALVCLVTGPLWLVYLVVAHPHDGRLPMVLAIALTVGGFVLLVARSPRRRDEDEDSDDDGAVV